MILAGVALLYPGGALTQTSSGFKISPTLIEERVDPGELLFESLEITNTGDEEITIYPKTRTIENTTAKGQPVFQTKGESIGLPLWIQFKEGEKKLTLKSGERKPISFTIEVPEDASPGGHFASIIFTREKGEVQTTGAEVGFGIGVVISLRVSGEINESGKISFFQTDKKIYEKPEITFLTRVLNTGNVLIRPVGIIEIKKSKGENTEAIDINRENGGVFPGGERIWETTWNPQKGGWGKYNAVISLVFGEDGRQTISEAAEFWILPIKLIGAVAGGSLAVILGLVFGIRAYIKRKIKNLQKEAARVRGTHKGKQIERRLAGSKQDSFTRELVTTTALMLGVSILILILILIFL